MARKKVTPEEEIVNSTPHRRFTQNLGWSGVRTKSWTMPIGRVFVYTPAD